MLGSLLRRAVRWRRRAQIALAIGTAFIGFLPGLAAAADTDTVLLRNGDRLTGEVKGLERGRLEFSTSSMSTVFVEWDKVVEVTAVGLFEIETTAGGLHLGRLVAATPGKVGLAVPQGRTLLFDVLAIVRIRPIKEGFFRRLSGSINLGGSYTRSSAVGQASLTSNVLSRRPSFQVSANFDTTVSVEKDRVSNTRTSFRMTYARLLANRWFVPGTGRFERNPELGYNLRSSIGGGIGRYLVQANSGFFGLGGGVVVNRELPVDGEGFNNVEGFAAVTASFYRYDSPKTDIDLSAVAYPSFTDGGRLRFELDTSVTYEIMKDFTVGVTVYDSFDNRPPAEGAIRNDVGVTLTIGWKFS